MSQEHKKTPSLRFLYPEEIIINSNLQFMRPSLLFSNFSCNMVQGLKKAFIIIIVSCLSRNATKLSPVEASLSMRVNPTVRCTTMPAAALCATAVRSPSLADASLLCIVNFTLSILCAHSASSSLTRVPSRNRMISHTVIPASLNSLDRRELCFVSC